METTPPTPAVPQSGPLEAHVTWWFFRRMAMLAAIFIGFGLFFYYDGTWGYPKSNKVHEKKTWINEGRKQYDELKAADKLADWNALAADKKWPLNPDGEPLPWESYATQNGWPSDPKFHSQAKIDEQFHFAWGCLIIGAFPLVLILLNRNKKLVADDHGFTPPGAKSAIPYQSVHQIDKRKWENKGLATISYKTTETGAEKTVKLDCLKFETDKAEEILRRLRANFSGVLIEKIVEEEDEPESPESGDEEPSNQPR
jgi:hypothetical protein